MKTFRDYFQRQRQAGDSVFAIAFVIVTTALAAAVPWQIKYVPATKLIAQPAFWPLVGLVMMAGFGTVHLLATLYSPRPAGRLQEVYLWLRSLEFVAWYYIYVTVIPIAGYLPATILFVMLLCLRLGYRSPALLAYGVLFSFGIALIFKAGLGVALPAGQIYEYLPDSLRNFMMKNF